jgi:NTE family protein
MLTDQPASSTVKAATELEVLAMSEAEFVRASADFPIIYRNIGRLLSERLRQSNRRLTGKGANSIALLLDCGAPPLLGYALACSLAWHTRRSTLLLFIGDNRPEQLQVLRSGMRSPELASGFLKSVGHANPGAPDAPGTSVGTAGAHLMLAEPIGAFASQALPSTLDELGSIYEQILVQLNAEDAESLSVSFPTVRMMDEHGAEPTAGKRAHKHTIRAWVGNTRPGANGPDQMGVIHVPALSPADEQALLGGVLPGKSGAGKALGWLARDLAGLKVGLALGAGSEKGYAHLGVLRVLAREGVPVDFVAGTSIGSGVAALLALGRDLEQIRAVVDRVGSAAFRPTLPTAGFLSSAGLRDGLRAALGEARFEDLLIPLAVIAADLTSGREVVFEHGLLWPALLASMSIPGVYPAVCMDRYALVDGGIVNPVPSNIVAGLGADVVIAVKLAIPAAIPLIGTAAAEGKGRPPSFFQAIPRTIEMMQSKVFNESASAATILVEPLFTNTAMVGWGLRRFTQGQVYEVLGEEAVEAALPRIAGALPWIRR